VVPPLLRRIVEVNHAMTLAASPAEADIVLACGTAPPPSTPAMLINPPQPPPGCASGPELHNWLFDPARYVIAADDPVMKDVDLRGLAVRSLRPWMAGDTASGRPAPGGVSSGDSGGAAGAGLAGIVPLLTCDGQVILARTADSGPSAPAAPRVYVAFNADNENTNASLLPGFVILITQGLQWLSGAAPTGPQLDYQTPMDAGPQTQGRPLKERFVPDHPATANANPWLWPGLYSDPNGQVHAVSLIGLARPAPAPPLDQTIDFLPLPQPQAQGRAIDLWPILALAAIALWLAGWAISPRR
jgi:hypothetical protein